MYKYQQWKFIINLLYLFKSYSEVKWDCNVFISLLFEIFLNFIFLMCPQIVSNWNLNSFLVGKVWRSERRRWDGLSPHWSHKSRQQGTFGVHVNICTNELWNLQKSWSQGSIFLGFHGNSSALIEHSQQRVDIQWICSLFKQAYPQNYVPIILDKIF